jgi:3-isopropylmalate dehydrogenase
MRIAVLPGEGIGAEITASTLAVLNAVDAGHALGLEYERHVIGLPALESAGSTFPPAVLEACRGADGVLLGPVDNLAYPPREQGGVNPSGAIRLGLDLYANIRPAATRAGLPHWGRTPMDLVIVRENTEGFYSDRNMHLGLGEFMPTPDLALSVRKISAQASTRIARTAFELARTRRRKVTVVHKANVLKLTENLFLREARKVAAAYPDVACDEQLVDSMAALLVRDAARFDVVLTTNMYGDILSDEATELSGSLGLAASINAGDDHCIAQAQHGSAPDIAGQDRANPVSLILSAAMLLGWLAQRHRRPDLAAAQRAIETAVDALIKDPATRTPDLGGPLGTKAFTAALCARIEEAAGRSPSPRAGPN